MKRVTYMRLVLKHVNLKMKMRRMEKMCTEIIAENERLHEIIADLQKGSAY